MTVTLGRSISTPVLQTTQKSDASGTAASSVLDPRFIANLPGTQLDPKLGKNYFPRQNSWNLIRGTRVERDKDALVKSRGKFIKAPRETAEYRQGSLPITTNRMAFGNVGCVDYTEVPSWDALDRHVLRFYAFGKETVCETNLENYRNKAYTILYYLQDDTIQISSPLPDNSGCGVFSALGSMGDKGLSSAMLKRCRLPKSDGSGEYVSPSDLKIGEDFGFLGRIVRISDCDGFTKKYYEKIGDPQPDKNQMTGNVTVLDETGSPSSMERIAQETPDNFQQTLAKKKVAHTKPMRNNEKIYRETMLGGGHINKNQQQFMDLDRKVCRFFAVVDDLITAQYERRPFIIMFFLSDDTIQIREQYPLNCGRDNFPLFCKRMRMPKGKVELRGPMDSAYQLDEYVSIKDFVIGGRVEMYNTSFYIYDADGFTREYFQKELKKPLEPKIDVRLPEKAQPRPPTPSYTGYGSWDDSMSSVVHLIPKKPRKDMAKLFFNEGKTLRFSAKFSGEVSEEDTMRRFLVTYNLFDDTVMIHEPPQRNLGIVTGRFLEKGVHLNQLTGKLFRPDDLLPGKEIKVASRQFIMLDLDEYSKNYFRAMESGEETYRNNVNLNLVLQTLRENLVNQFPQVRDVFRRFDADRNGVLCYHEWERSLQKFGFMLSPEETLAIMLFFDPEKKGQVDYTTFCDRVLDPDFHKGNLMNKPELVISAEELAAYADIAAAKTVERAETEKVRRAVRTIGEVFISRANMTTRLLAEFNSMGQESTKTWDQIRTGFLKLGYVFELEDIQRVVNFCCPGCDLQKVPVFDFLSKLKVSYHDMSQTR